MVDKWRGYSHAGFNKGCREGGGVESASPLSSSGASNAGQLAGWGAAGGGIGKMGLRPCGAALFILGFLYTVAGESCFCGGFVGGGMGYGGNQ